MTQNTLGMPYVPLADWGQTTHTCIHKANEDGGEKEGNQNAVNARHSAAILLFNALLTFFHTLL